FIVSVIKEKPKGIFLTGDISNGGLIYWHLKLLASLISCPIYFVLGNHDMHFSSIEKVYDKIRKLCKQYPNLIWMTDAGIVPINDEAAIIGNEGWYDAANGKPGYLKLTIDWWMTKNFRKLPSMKHRIAVWREMSQRSVDDIVAKLEYAIKLGYKNIHILTHFPPWASATKHVGTLLEGFWLPYNVNRLLGEALEEVMKRNNDRYITVWAGHTHDKMDVRIAHNIKCKVSANHLFGIPKLDDNIIYI
ncbi:MAG: metallophosphoesterase, partial [Legionellales bacterium]